MSDHAGEPRVPRRRLASWVVAGVVLLGLVVGLVVVYIAQVTGEDGDAPSAGTRETATPGTAPPGTAIPEAAAPGADDGDGAASNEEACETQPFAPAFDILPPVDELSEGGESDFFGFRSWSCQFGMTDSSSKGVLIANATVDTNAIAAEARFNQLVAEAVNRDRGDTYEELDGDWDESFLAIKEEDASTDVWSWVLEDELVIEISFLVEGEAADVETQRGALAQISENVRDAMRE